MALRDASSRLGVVRTVAAMAAIAAVGLGLGLVTVAILTPAAGPQSNSTILKAHVSQIARLNHLDHRPNLPFDLTDADAAEDAALWDAAEAAG